jgi:hypothetical protein
VSVEDLPVISRDGVPPNASQPHVKPVREPEPLRAEPGQETDKADIFTKIERLADLQQKGILSPDEFAAKKTELLSRL